VRGGAERLSDRVCCNCRHNIRTDEGVASCEIDGHYIGYVACLEDWCRHWASDAEYWAEKEIRND